MVRACMRQSHDPKESRVGFRSSGAVEQARTKGTTKLAKILSAPARCLPLSRRQTTMKLAPPHANDARGMQCALGSVRSASFRRWCTPRSARTGDTRRPVCSEGPSHWNAQDTACLPLAGGMAASLVDEFLMPTRAAFRQAAAKRTRVTARTALSVNAFRSLPG